MYNKDICRRAPSQRLRARLMAAVATLAIALPGQPAHAWKPKTHIYLAEEALRDALDNGKVTIYETDRATGRIIGPLGEFDVDPQILAALKAGQKQFRAGVLGPDAYPDILTGQQIIHPEEAEAVDHGAGGSNAWLTHLWERGFVNGATPQVRAFTVGYLVHAAGDVFAHTYVNHYAGGEFTVFPDPTNAVKHLVLEGYIGKRTPQTFSATTTRTRVSGGPRNPRKRDDLGLDPDTTNDPIVYEDIRLPITQEDTSISGVEGFIYNELTFAKPGSIMLTRLMKGEGTSRSIPFIFSEKRNQLQAEVDEYERTRLSLSGPARVAYAATHGAQAEYKKAWIADIDEGLKALPAVSHAVAKAIVYNEAGSDMGAADDILSKYVGDHLISMLGFPDAAIVTVQTVAAAIDAISPPFIAEFLKDLLMAPLNAIIKGQTGKTPQEWAHYLSNPESHFDEVLNAPGGGHGGHVAHRIDLKTFNREQLKINDDGYGNSSLKWKIEDLPPAFNTLQLTKLMFLGDAGMQQLEAALKVKGVGIGGSPGQYRNYMLGWVRSMDAGNQWQGGGTAPRPAFAAAYSRLFLAQVGEAALPQPQPQPEPQTGPVPGPEPVPPPPPPPPPPPVPGNPDARWWPRPDDLRNKSLMASYLEGDWATELGRLTIARTGAGDVDHWIGHIYRNGQPAFVLEDLVPSEDASGVTGTWREVDSSQKHSIRLVLNQRDGDRFAAGADGYIGGLFELTGTRILDAPAYEEPLPPPPPPPGPREPEQPQPVPSGAFKAINAFSARLDKVVEAYGYPTRQVHVFVTVKNLTGQSQYVPSGFHRAILTDEDGVSQERNQVWRASGEPAALFNATPVVQPGGELKIRYVFTPDEGSVPNLFTMSSGGRTAEFPVSMDGPQQPGPQEPERPQPQTPADDFQPLGKWDVRVDKIENPREDRLTHVYITLRNASTQNQLQTGDVWVYLEDTSGATQRSGQGVRAIPGPPQLFGSPPPVTQPGKTIKAKYIFDRVRGASITRVTVVEGEYQADYDF